MLRACLILGSAFCPLSFELTIFFVLFFSKHDSVLFQLDFHLSLLLISVPASSHVLWSYRTETPIEQAICISVFSSDLKSIHAFFYVRLSRLHALPCHAVFPLKNIRLCGCNSSFPLIACINTVIWFSSIALERC